MNRRVAFHPVRAMWPAWLAAFAISGGVNILVLAGALYTLQVYDRVLTSHNVDTLIALSGLLAGVYLVLALLDALRGQLLLRMGEQADAMLMPIAHAALLRLPLAGDSAAMAVQPARDVDTIRGFMAGPGPAALLDVPWSPLFLVFVWLLDPLLGLMTLLGLVLLGCLAVAGDLASRRSSRAASARLLDRIAELDAGYRNAEAVAAMGLGANASRRFHEQNEMFLAEHRRAGDIRAVFISLSRVLRLALQAAVIGIGAWLAIRGALSAGAIIAASIGSARALAPVEQAIQSLRGIAEMRTCLARLGAVAESTPAETRPLQLPEPRQMLAVEGVTVALPGRRTPVITGIDFTLRAGEALAVVGQSGAGKSTLARALTGVWSPSQGAIKLDGASLDRWHPDDRGRFIGYMPQQIALFPGTIAENIARLETAPPSETIIAAARGAGVHDLIVSMPNGYETIVSADGAPLSSGQRQLVGLARAIYGDPFLLVLDEPNASVDLAGQEALAHAIAAARRRGGVVVVVAQRRSLIAQTSHVAVMDGGRLRTLATSREFLAAHLRPATVKPGKRAGANGASNLNEAVSP